MGRLQIQAVLFARLTEVAGNWAERVGGELGTAREAGALEPTGAEAVARRFARTMLNRDSRAAAACLSAGARILTADGTEVAGREAAEGVLRQITSSEHTLEIRIGRGIVAEGVASCTQFWRRTASGPGQDGSGSATAARLILVRSGAHWEIVIASPWE